ncbi:MAG TPA: LacI family DNA-binding transcriptional regulator, partial [Kiritimatiellia bacterium]
MTLLPNQRDVAKAAGVSGATVSRVVNNAPRVTERTRKLVESAMERLGYTPNEAARRLIRGRSDTIGVVMTKIASGFFTSVMQGIGTAAQGRGYATTFIVATLQDRKRAIYRDQLEGGKADGLVIMEPWLSPARIQEIEAIAKPVVLIQQSVKSDRVSSVAVNNRAGARLG